jgi:hypothetical protein
MLRGLRGRRVQGPVPSGPASASGDPARTQLRSAGALFIPPGADKWGSTLIMELGGRFRRSTTFELHSPGPDGFGYSGSGQERARALQGAMLRAGNFGSAAGHRHSAAPFGSLHARPRRGGRSAENRLVLGGFAPWLRRRSGCKPWSARGSRAGSKRESKRAASLLQVVMSQCQAPHSFEYSRCQCGSVWTGFQRTPLSDSKIAF